MRRWTALLVALCCAAATPVHAAHAPMSLAAVDEAQAAGQALAEDGKYLAAAAKLTEAMNGLPIDAANRSRRNQVAIEVVTAYRLAFDETPSDCAPLLAGLKLADAYLASLREMFGQASMVDRDYGAMSTRRSELDELRMNHQCPELGEAADPAPTPKQGPESAPLDRTPPETTPAPRRSRAPAFGAGVAVSAGLTVGLAVGAGILFTKLRKPGEGEPLESGGSLYQDIVREAQANSVATDRETNMCSAGADVKDVQVACSAWLSGKNGMIAMVVLSGVFAVSAGVFAGLLVREKRTPRGEVARAWRRHQVQLGAAPRIGGGATLTAGFRF